MKNLAILFLIFLLSGCMGTTSRTQTNNEFDEILKIGETSKTSIEELLGRPDHKEVATSDYEYWRYTSSLQKIKSVHHLPGKNIQNIYDLKIWITPQGVLMDFQYVLDNS